MLQSRALVPGRAEPKPEGDRAKTVKTERVSFRSLPEVSSISLFLHKEQWLCVERVHVCAMNGNVTPSW